MLKSLGVFAVGFALTLLLFPVLWVGALALAKEALVDTSDPLSRQVPEAPEVDFAPFDAPPSVVEAGAVKSEFRGAAVPVFAEFVAGSEPTPGNAPQVPGDLRVAAVDARTGIVLARGRLVAGQTTQLGPLPAGEHWVVLHEADVPATHGYLARRLVQIDPRRRPDPLPLPILRQNIVIGSVEPEQRDGLEYVLTVDRTDDPAWILAAPADQPGRNRTSLAWQPGQRAVVDGLGPGDYELRLRPLDDDVEAPPPIPFKIPGGDPSQPLEVEVRLP